MSTSGRQSANSPDQAPSTSLFRREHVPVLVLLLATAGLLGWWGSRVWLVLLYDGLIVAALLVSAAGWGAWPAVWLGMGRRAAGQQACLAVAFGLGMLGLLTLALGAAGLLTQVIAWAVLIVGWALGVGRVCRSRANLPTNPSRPPERTASLALAAALLLTLAVPLAVALFCASIPPGVFWNGEARGYDVLEYHLQGPREYFDAGRIEFLPHNVYTSFPQQMEMLYLLLMHLAGGPLAGAIPAQLLHTACGILAVLVLAAWTPAGWPRRVVAITAGTVPWMAYLGCLAYVELGMILFAAAAAGLVCDQLRDDIRLDWRASLAAGLLAGLAGGCKYTALAFVAGGLGLAWLLVMRGSLNARAKRLAMFTTGVLVAFSPWLIRNAAFTGNPVYPFAYKWFGGMAWSAEQDQQWERGHRLPAERDSAVGRLKITANEVFASRMFGPAIFVLAAAGVVFGRSRVALMLALWFALIALAWATLTHMPGRFAVPIVVPLAMLAGLGMTAVAGSRPWGAGLRPVAVMLALAVGGALVNDAKLWSLLRQHTEWWAQRGVPPALLVGATEGVAANQPLSGRISTEGRVWLVGEARAFYLPPNVHYTVVFSRDPWLEQARAATPEQTVAWLRTQNVAHVVFSWHEIDRLRGSYGFPAFVTRDWVASLSAAGLRRVVPDSDAEEAGVEVYEVLPG